MRDDDGRFRKGYSGNTRGRPKGRGLKQEIERSLSKKVVKGSRMTRLGQIAEILVSKARGGDLRAIELILKRLWPERVAVEMEGTPTVIFRDYTGVEHERPFQREGVERTQRVGGHAQSPGSEEPETLTVIRLTREEE